MRASCVLPFFLGVVSLVGCGESTIGPPATDASLPDAAGDAGGDAADDAAATPDTAAAPDASVAPDAAVALDVAAADASPADVPMGDVAPPEDVAPGSCARATALTRDPVGAAQVARVAGGVVVAWYPYGGSDVVVQGFSDDLVPQGSPLALSLLTNGVDGISLSFEGSTGVLGAGASLYFLSVEARLSLRLAGRRDFPRRLVRHAHMDTATLVHAVFADGTSLFTNGARISESTPERPLDPPHGARVSIAETRGGYIAVEPRETAGGSRLQMRRFTFSLGVAREVANTWGDGTSASPAVVAGDALLRLVQSDGREVDVSLEQRALSDLTVRSVTVLQRAAAWNVTRGALSASGGEPFVAWAARPSGGGFNSQVQAMWADEREPRPVFSHVREVPVAVLSAASNASRAWVLLGLDGNGSRYTLFGRCIDRVR